MIAAINLAVELANEVILRRSLKPDPAITRQKAFVTGFLDFARND